MMKQLETGASIFSRKKRLWMLAGAAALVVAVIWIVVSSSRDGRAKKGAAGVSANQSESGDMAGMNMSGNVRLTAAQIREFGVTFDTVRMRPLQNEVRATASITFDETRISQITPKFSGSVERLYVNATGQPVRRGQAVAALFSPELVAAQRELLLAASLDRSMGQTSIPGVAAASPNLLASARQRLRLWDVSDAEINAVLRGGQPKRTVTLYSPVGGIVTEKSVVQGQSVMAGAPLLTVADLSTVWAIAELREADAAGARVGATASVEINAFPGERIAGRITYIYPTLQEQSRTIRARVVLRNPGGRLKPGMFATVMLSSPQAAALTVPAAALIETGDRAYVFVQMPGGELMPHDVTAGRRTSGFVEILAGVDAGQIVVTSAQFLLDSESNIGEVTRSMMGQGAAGAMSDMAPGATTGSMNDKGADLKGMKMPPAPRR